MSDNNIISIKDYAKQSGRTVQSVYQQMKREGNAVLLQGHIVEKSIGKRKIKYLDNYAVQVLEESRNNNPAVVTRTDQDIKIEELLQTNHNQLVKITEQANKIAEQAEELLNTKALLLESTSQSEEEKKKREEAESKQQELSKELEKQNIEAEKLHNEMQRLQELLTSEQTRKLSFKERLFGRKVKD
jgi:hypothetical protein